MKHPVIINSSVKHINNKKLFNTTPLEDALQMKEYHFMPKVTEIEIISYLGAL